MAKPLDYYDNNLGSTLSLLAAMRRHGVRRIVFSSSATVYGEHEPVPMKEDFPTSATNPYGGTKVMQEQILRDAAVAEPSLRVALLRYFNPVGAHPSGTIGEDPSGIPNNLMPLLAQVAVGRREKLLVFGDDYATPDGTGRRDYLHVEDLAAGHVAALDRIADSDTAVSTWNLGTGRADLGDGDGARVLPCLRPRPALRGRPASARRHRRVVRRPDAARRPSWAGPRGARSTRCAPTPGAGSRTTRTATPTTRRDGRRSASVR